MIKYIVTLLTLLVLLGSAQTPQGNRVAWTDTTKIARNAAFVDINNIMPGWTNVKQVAKGDGVTDDAVALQAIENLGTHMYFPVGTYLMKSGIVIDGDNRKIRLEEGAVIKFDTTGAATPNVRLFDVRCDTFEATGPGILEGSWTWAAATDNSRLFGTSSANGNCAFFIYPQHTNGSRLKRLRIEGLTIRGFGYSGILIDDLLTPGNNVIDEADIKNNVFDYNAQHIFWDQSDGTVQEPKHIEISSNWLGRTNGPDTSSTYTSGYFSALKGNQIWLGIGAEVVIVKDNYSELAGRYFLELWPSSGGSLDDRTQYAIVANNTTKNTVGQNYSIIANHVLFEGNYMDDHNVFNGPEIHGEEIRIVNNRGYWKIGYSGYGTNGADWLDVKTMEVTGNAFYTHPTNKSWGDPFWSFPFGDKFNFEGNTIWVNDTLNADVVRLRNITNSRFVNNTVYMNTAKYRNTSDEAVWKLSYSQNVDVDNNRIIFNTVPDTVLEGMMWQMIGNDDVRWTNNKAIVKYEDTLTVKRAIAGEGVVASTVRNVYTWNNSTGQWTLDSLTVADEGFIRNAPTGGDATSGRSFIVGENPTGDWEGYPRHLATYTSSWAFTPIKDFIQHQTFNGNISGGLNPFAMNAKGRLPKVGNTNGDVIVAYDNGMTRCFFKGNDFGGSGKIFIEGTTPGVSNYEFEVLSSSSAYVWDNVYYRDDNHEQEFTINGFINNTQTVIPQYREMSARDAFTTTATSDTVRVPGTTTTSIFQVNAIDATPVADDQVTYTTWGDTLAVHRPAGTTSGLNYSWKRLEK